MKAFIERCGMVSRANGDMLKQKIGAAVIAARRMLSAQSILFFAHSDDSSGIELLELGHRTGPW